MLFKIYTDIHLRKIERNICSFHEKQISVLLSCYEVLAFYLEVVWFSYIFYPNYLSFTIIISFWSNKISLFSSVGASVKFLFPLLSSMYLSTFLIISNKRFKLLDYMQLNEYSCMTFQFWFYLDQDYLYWSYHRRSSV